MWKRTFVCLVLVGLTTLPGRAIQITFNEDSVTRNWFNVVWGLDPSAPLAFITSGGFSDGGAMDMTTSIGVDHVNPIQPGDPSDPTPFFDHFTITFAVGSRLFSSATISGFAGTSVFALPGEDYGAQVLYGQALPSGRVPDSGSTLVLLAIAAVGAGLAAQRVRSRRARFLTT